MVTSRSIITCVVISVGVFSFTFFAMQRSDRFASWKTINVYSHKFIASMSYGRLSNRYYQIKIMMQLAYLLNRTLILPPYQGVEIDEIFDIDAANRYFYRYPLVITWGYYKKITKTEGCICVGTVYDLENGDQFEKCEFSPILKHCNRSTQDPILGTNRVVLKSFQTATKVHESLMLVTGRWVWEYFRVEGLSQLLQIENNKTWPFHLDFKPSIWEAAERVHEWLCRRANSSNRSTFAIHMRLGDLASEMNIDLFLKQAKTFSLKHQIPETQIFVATDGNSTDIKRIRHTFTESQIECPTTVEAACMHSIRKLSITQAVAAKTTYFIGSPSSTFTGVINTMRAARSNVKSFQIPSWYDSYHRINIPKPNRPIP